MTMERPAPAVVWACEREQMAVDLAFDGDAGLERALARQPPAASRPQSPFRQLGRRDFLRLGVISASELPGNG
jgi:hypothetical protein